MKHLKTFKSLINEGIDEYKYDALRIAKRDTMYAINAIMALKGIANIKHKSGSMILDLLQSAYHNMEELLAIKKNEEPFQGEEIDEYDTYQAARRDIRYATDTIMALKGIPRIKHGSGYTILELLQSAYNNLGRSH